MNSLTTTARRHVLAVCALACAALAVPATGWAASGGSGISPGGSGLTPASGGPSGAGTTPPVQSGNVPVSTTGDGVTLTTNASAMLRRGLSFSGTAPRRLAGDVVEIQRSGHQTHWQWASTVTATIQPGGSFSAVWHTNHIGRFAIRAVVMRPGMAQSAANAMRAGASSPSATSTPSLTITVYRPSLATLYGPGLYGRHTACGMKLTRTTIGVANRTLKCGTKVAVYYGGETMIVPVIDRGPYANGADWDLTMATAKALGIDATAKIGAVSLPQR